MIMATESPYPPFEIPDIDIWEFLFEQERDVLNERGGYSLEIVTRSLFNLFRQRTSRNFTSATKGYF
jgi:hypothetical protein